MSPAVVVVISGFVVGAAIWRVMIPAAPSRRRTRSVIRPERRRKSRVVPPPDKPAELQIMGKDFLEIPEVRDISDSGVAISVPHKFNGHKPTQEVDLLLTLHGQGTVRARGAIRHVSYTRSDTATFGVELVDIDEADRTKIRRYLTQVEEDGTKDVPGSAVPTPILDPGPGRPRK
jgi:c-di-GMP-binding flagellar brake protein YcgR